MFEAQSRLYTNMLQLLIVVLAGSLAWFAFIYYPRVVSDYKSGNFPSKPVIAPAVATSNRFPIETAGFRAVYEEGSNSYYVFVQGKSLDSYLDSRNSAKLALKSALSVNNLCNFSVLYVSTANLEVPQRFANDSDC